MPSKKVKMTLKFPKCLHLEKLLLAYVIVLLMPYNFCNHNIFISLKIAVIFMVDKVIAPPCISNSDFNRVHIMNYPIIFLSQKKLIYYTAICRQLNI